MALDKRVENYEYKKFIWVGINMFICNKLHSYMIKEEFIDKKRNFYDDMSFSDLSKNQIKDLFRSSTRVMMGKEKAEKIGKKFNVDEDLFKLGNTKIIDLGIKDEEWHDLMNKEITGRHIDVIRDEQKIKVIEEKVDIALKYAVKELNDETKSGGVVFNICYYFKYGKTNQNSFGQMVERAIACLDKINYGEVFTIDEKHLAEIEKDIDKIDDAISKMRAAIKVKRMHILH